MKLVLVRIAALIAFLALLSLPAHAGHELSYYPSFYPQEIKLDVMDPVVAARLLGKTQIQGYVGPDPFRGAAPPAHVTYAESLDAWIVLTFAKPGGDPAPRCATAARVARVLGGAKTGITIQPYPVTPWHPDFFQHADLAEAALKRLAPDAERAPAAPRVKAVGSLAKTLAGAALKFVERDADATLEEVSARELAASHEARANGWTGPPWIRDGWFHAHLLQSPAVTDPAARRQVEEAYGRLVTGAYESPAERLALERRLVTTLGRGCERVVLGYTTRREALSVEYSNGVENVARDPQAGIVSAIFVRTVKLKDFPWNGWLRLGVEKRPTAAWNPIAGFGDDAGRLMRAALIDPALLPSPFGPGWMANRAAPTVEGGGPFEVPADALASEPETGTLKAVPPGTTARAKLTYRVLAGALHDGTRMSVADLLYPFVFAARWSAPQNAPARRWDPVVERQTAVMREAFVAVRVARVDVQFRDYADVQVLNDVPVVEVYLRHGLDPAQLGALAPPWSAVPWQLTVLMEEAVARGLAAFSEEEARKRRVPWLDLARDRKLKDALAALADDFERKAYVPESLRGLVSVEQARQRWAALKRFGRARGHWLVTNGPYVLDKWSADSVTLTVFRDLTYPIGVGAFDRYAAPLRGFVGRAERKGDRLEIQADVEKIEKFERSYKIMRGPYKPEPAGEKVRDTLAAWWVAIGPGDEVAAAGASELQEAGRLVVDLKGRLKPGAYRLLLAVAVNGNIINPEVKVLPYRVAD